VVMLKMSCVSLPKIGGLCQIVGLIIRTVVMLKNS
jgi:hypothetical protein